MSLKDQPEFRTVWSPESYARTTSSAVRYVPVLLGGVVIGYLWASAEEDAARYVPRQDGGDAAFNAAVAWVARLRWAKANGLTPSQVLRHWMGEAEDARAGWVPSGSERGLPGLEALEALAAE